LPATRQAINILCCMCGIPFKPSETGTRICLRCLTTQSDVTEGITKQGIVNFCRMCKRYMRPPWVYCERESRELLSICMQKVRGLNRVKIIDASFVWTEPHSRRIKLKMTV
jgi:nonsense-mediated mRNA decay protein 3